MAQAIDGVQMNASAAELNTLEGVLTGASITYYVTKTGSDSNDGLSWGQAFLTIQNAFDVVTARGAERGRATIAVGPGGYVEDLITPLNTIAPFGRLIAYNPTGRSFGAVWLLSSTASEPALTIRARGWLIDGFEFDANSGAGCILLDGDTANSSAGGTNIRNCLFVGANDADDYGIHANNINSSLVVIEDCYFYQFQGKGAIYTSASGSGGGSMLWVIARCKFQDNVKHLAVDSSGVWQALMLHDCHFGQIGTTNTATVKIDMRGGSTNHIGPNNFFDGAYTEANGYFGGGGNNVWRGNHTAISEGGTAQTFPA